MILACDIGGTNARLALFKLRQDNSLVIVKLEKFPSKTLFSLELTVKTFLQKNKLDKHNVLKAAWFSLAGPISGSSCSFTNLNLTVDLFSLRQSLDFIPEVGWSNDLVALGFGIPLLPEDSLLLLHGKKRTVYTGCETLNKAVLAPGTGLGESLLIGNEVYPSEGAHADFAPQNEEDLELWRFLHYQYGHVSYEHVLSGAGLVNIYGYLEAKNNNVSAPDLSPEEISARALTKSCPLCTEALDIFVRILGAEAGNLALKFMALGGVYIGGGIPPKIKTKLLDEAFKKAFTAKGRFSAFLDPIPVYLILEENTPLIGAAFQSLKKLGLDNGLIRYSPF